MKTQPPSPPQQPLRRRLIATDPGDPKWRCVVIWSPGCSAGKDRPSGAASEMGFPVKGRQLVPRGRGERKQGGNTTMLRATFTKAFRELKISKLFF